MLTTQEAGLQALTAAALVPAKVSPCGIYGGQSGIETGFPWSALLFPCQ